MEKGQLCRQVGNGRAGTKDLPAQRKSTAKVRRLDWKIKKKNPAPGPFLILNAGQRFTK